MNEQEEDAINETVSETIEVMYLRFDTYCSRLRIEIENQMTHWHNRMIALNERLDALDPKYIEAANTASDFFKHMIENNLNNFEFFLKSMSQMSGRILKLEQKIESLETKVDFPWGSI